MRRKKRVGLATKIFVAIFAVYAAFTLVSLQIQISAKREEQAALQAQIEEQSLRNAEIEALLNSEDNDEYIARIARDKLGYVSPGERVFVDISSK
ncbi:MAG TPA: septum formation initiator family protein [Candidatus Ventrousia excrementavium]|uniref:Septum formation initiator family protein n=1 Tax=Candidatus Ventrousia excrementavium TaxID=2840961 RepID=A0A9D1LM84_9CLOT|nr:septum formation initiator family protein [Candidatus Ventrousia excrementavium]